MKSVLISIQPKWCELIANSKKTVEVRKTRPKLDTPFKCYIYMTAGDAVYPVMINGAQYICSNVGGKCVIGEFVCDRIDEIGYSPEMHGKYISDINDLHKVSCIDFEQMFDYIADGYGYGWHISDLEIYDTPKELGKYIVPSKIGCCNEGKCRGCKWFDRGNGFNLEDDCNAKFDTDEYKPLRRPPQSWCYVEELK